MQIKQIRIQHVRNVENQCLDLNSGINLIQGANAAGKSSFIEAIYLLSRTKSFRASRIRDVIQHKQKELNIFCEYQKNDSPHRLGIAKGHGKTEIKLNGVAILSASELAYEFPVYLITPESHILLTGTPKNRRHWLDWSLFHVEQDFLSIWKDYHKALRHRNSLLKSGGKSTEFETWESLMASSAGEITQLRQNYLEKLNNAFSAYLAKLFPEKAEIRLLPGFEQEKQLKQILIEQREGDSQRGFTQSGPHKADIQFVYQGLEASKTLSKGQMKLFLSALTLAQAELTEKTTGETAVLLLDDLSAELDSQSTEALYRLISEQSIQSVITTLDNLPEILVNNTQTTRFHVEHGSFKKMV